MKARAVARYVRVSPRKADRVLRTIRGLPVDKAQEVLAFTTRPIAKQIGKVLKSAVANAGGHEEKVAVEELRVEMAVAGAGPTMKRFLPRAQGRATPILKRSSHITIVVGDGRAVSVGHGHGAVAAPAGTKTGGSKTGGKTAGAKTGSAKTGGAKAAPAKAHAGAKSGKPAGSAKAGAAKTGSAKTGATKTGAAKTGTAKADTAEGTAGRARKAPKDAGPKDTEE